MSLADIVNVVVTTQNPGVSQAGFGVPLILGYTASWSELYRAYGNITDVAADFVADDPEYLAANAYFSQNPAPTRVLIARGTHKPTQKFAIGAASVGVGTVYKLRVAAKNAGTWTSQDASYTSAASAAWVLSTPYTKGTLITNDSGKFYLCITAGTSAGSGGPTGTTADITDGSAHWMYAGTGSTGDCCNDAIVYNLLLAVNALAAPVVAGDTGATKFATTLQGSAGAKTLQFLANAAGVFFGVEVYDMALLSLGQTQTDPGVGTDLTAIRLVTDSWYELQTLFNSGLSTGLVKGAAVWAEANKKLYVASVQDSTCATVAYALSGTDILTVLRDAAYGYTAPFFHTANDQFADAAEAGRFLPLDPGSENWRLKTLAGITAKPYTPTHITNLEAKYANYYTQIGGVNLIGGDGKVSANEYIDVIRGIDWWKNGVQTRLINVLIQNNKVPYTDSGIAILEAQIKAQNNDGIKQGLIAPDPAPTVSVPKAADVSPSDKALRKLGSLNTSWTLAGAINKLTVNAVVSA